MYKSSKTSNYKFINRNVVVRRIILNTSCSNSTGQRLQLMSSNVFHLFGNLLVVFGYMRTKYRRDVQISFDCLISMSTHIKCTRIKRTLFNILTLKRSFFIILVYAHIEQNVEKDLDFCYVNVASEIISLFCIQPFLYSIYIRICRYDCPHAFRPKQREYGVRMTCIDAYWQT